MAAGADLAALKVLVVDDQDFVRAILRKMLEITGVGSVVEAPDGASGLEAVDRERPDVVICDIQMRPLDGFGFVRRLRATPGGESPPVILLSAHVDAATQAAARALGVAALLAKPVLPPTLAETITRALAGKG